MRDEREVLVSNNDYVVCLMGVAVEAFSFGTGSSSGGGGGGGGGKRWRQQFLRSSEFPCEQFSKFKHSDWI